MLPVVVTTRLTLRTLVVDELEMLLAGSKELHGAAIPNYWPHEIDGEVDMLCFFVGRLRESPDLADWRIRAMVHSTSRTMIGHIGFHGPPQDGQLELGYTVFEPHRRQGFASEAIVALMNAANTEHDIDRFRLSISPRNEPSLALAERLGFTNVGERMDDEDGLELLFERSWTMETR